MVSVSLWRRTRVFGEVMENGEDWLSEAVYAYDRGEWLQSVAAALIGLVAER